jgi:hypothetical protein
VTISASTINISAVCHQNTVLYLSLIYRHANFCITFSVTHSSTWLFVHVSGSYMLHYCLMYKISCYTYYNVKLKLYSIMYTLSNKNQAALKFIKAVLLPTSATLAIIIRVVCSCLIFVHSWHFSTFHSLQSSMPDIY